ncbi:Protein still life [Blattella germanica]|nr:Protein still life [Blattella germanica]
MFTGPGSSASMNKSSTLPLPHRLSMERPSSSAARDREGYYSDRNELIRDRERERERERERDRDRGYLSDHNSRCTSCLGESARAQWFRHSDGWRSGSSTFGSGSGSGLVSGSGTGQGTHKRSPWDSLPSLRHEGSLGDSGYKSNRADSFEQRRVLIIFFTAPRYYSTIFVHILGTMLEYL